MTAILCTNRLQLKFMYAIFTGRCSIVDYNGEVLCDIYARPDEVITAYRTRWSGLRKRDMIKAVPFESAQSHIKNIIKVSFFSCSSYHIHSNCSTYT